MPTTIVHHRRSLRLKGYDYRQPGAYFITMVCKTREELFGKIEQGEVQLSRLGQIAVEEWVKSSTIRKEVCLYEDEFIIMPNHIHGIVWIVEVGADGIRPMDGMSHIIESEGTRRAPQPQPTKPEPQLQHQPESTQRSPVPQPPGRKPRSLGSFIAGYKAAVTSRARREMGLDNIWQRNYYEHIIRNEKEFERIWDYIDTNPLRWEEDQLRVVERDR